jgi:[NiFe] hydrogenase large subunit
MARIVIDPVTRIEGHLKLEVEVSGGQVTSAWSSGTLFRGIELILQGRDPEDAWLFTQRVCGVCTWVHGQASVRCVENALGLTVPENARIVRNLLMGGQYVHDHPVHFYALHALDWVDIVSALSADPVATASLAATISPTAPTIDFAATKTRLATFAASNQLGPFADGYWGHSAMALTPAENLLFASHYLLCLRQQIKAANMHAIFGAKNPHLQSIRVGGVTCSNDINAARIAEFRAYLTDMRNFIDTVYIPDVKYIASKYPAWASIGGGTNYLTYGDFPLNAAESSKLFEGGVVWNKNIATAEALDISKISEHVQHSWYSGSNNHPSTGTTTPAYDAYSTDAKYSWLKAPRYNTEPMEVGPLARMLVAYASGNTKVVPMVNSFLSATGLTAAQLHSTLGRTACRALETKLIADEMDTWLNQLVVGGPTFIQPTMPMTAQGFGLNEAPRGALGHWINIQNRTIGNYQLVVPSTWNLGPRCSANKPSPVEAALVGTPVADTSKPLEILRVVHSFDPCLACAVHVIDRKKGKTYQVNVK